MLRHIGTALGVLVGSSIATWHKHGSPTPYIRSQMSVQKEQQQPMILSQHTLPTRAQQLKELTSGKEYDVLIIGGGATGCGCALDAVTRGFKTALVEADDFASGTSSRSTKLVHGGVRYLQNAIQQFDYNQYKLVREALKERAVMLKSAPHLVKPLPILMPVYNWWQMPCYWAGIKCYDFLALSSGIARSHILSSKRTLELFPMLKQCDLCGGIVYYDAQMDDARLCLAVATTAAKYGANIYNHAEVIRFLKKDGLDGRKKLYGAEVRDNITGRKFVVRAKCIVNATGVFTDSVRQMDNVRAKKICAPSSGVHITLPDYYSPKNVGFFDPSTENGRAIFFFPWQGHTIAGTTDVPMKVTKNPKPTTAEVQFVVHEIQKYLNKDFDVRRADVLSAWCGMRPLVYDPNNENEESLARSHIVHVSDSKLVTIAGGTWTTYRVMAEQAIDEVVKQIVPDTSTTMPPKSITAELKLDGALDWTPTMNVRLVQDFGIYEDVAQHLCDYYGDNAVKVAEMAHNTDKRWPVVGVRLHPLFPYIEAEIRYGVQEYACTAVDMIARRLRLSFLDAQAAQEILPQIVDVMAGELGWSRSERQKQLKTAQNFLKNEMGLELAQGNVEKIKVDLSSSDVQVYKKRFAYMDKGNKGHVSINTVREVHRLEHDMDLDNVQLHELLNEIDTRRHGDLDLEEYLQLITAIKTGDLKVIRAERMAERMTEQSELRSKLHEGISVDRSGGGV